MNVAPEQRGWQHRRRQQQQQGDEDEEEFPARVQAQQLLDYIMAANADHFSQADTAVRRERKGMLAIT